MEKVVSKKFSSVSQEFAASGFPPVAKATHSSATPSSKEDGAVGGVELGSPALLGKAPGTAGCCHNPPCSVSDTTAVVREKARAAFNTEVFLLLDWSNIGQNLENNLDSEEQFLALPVRYGRNDVNPQYETLFHYDIKELRQALKHSRLTSPYLNNVFESIFNSYDLVPAHC